MQKSTEAAATALASAVGAVRLGEPRSWRGLTVFPLLNGGDRTPTYDNFGVALAAGTFRVVEVSESGVVAQLRAENEGMRPVLLLDGEEIIGAKQNRAFNLTVLVPAKTTMDIPVSCVEQGRWHARSRAFEESGRAMFARGRARKARHVTGSLRRCGRPETDQSAVWDDVALKLRDLDVASDTMAMADAYDAHHVSLHEYLERFTAEPAQVGAVYALDGVVTGLELFDTADAFRAAAPKLVQSYACELLHVEPSDAVVDVANAASLLHDVATVQVTEHAATGAGLNLRFDDGHLSGGALALDTAVIHLFAFRPAAFADDRPQGPRRRRGQSGQSDQRGASGPDGPVGPTPAQALIRQGVMRCRDAEIFDVQPPTLDLPPAMLNDRMAGMLLGLAIGDALGNTTEGLLPAERHARYGEVRDYLPNRHAAGERIGLPSDDTQLAFRTLRRLLADGGLEPQRLARDFCDGRIFGIGSAVRAFIRAFKDEGVPWQRAGQHSAGNGALMRIAPVVLPHLRAPSSQLWSDAAVAGMVTHNDPASIGACVAFTNLLWQLFQARRPPSTGWWLETFVRVQRDVEGDEPRYEPRSPQLRGATPLWAFTEQLVDDALRHQRETLAACESWYSGAYLLETVPSVLYILERHSDDPEEAIIRAVNDTKDNDTIAAIVGAAVGALHGASALPPLWTAGLAGRIAEDDDGELFRLIGGAERAFTR
jgi:ADP-ribosyl-[dinitrogen reductase] hydrolase